MKLVSYSCFYSENGKINNFDGQLFSLASENQICYHRISLTYSSIEQFDAHFENQYAYFQALSIDEVELTINLAQHD